MTTDALPKKETKAGKVPDVLPEEFRLELHPNSPALKLLSTQVIWDDEFNYNRQKKNQFSPFDLDHENPGEADSLQGKIGGDTPVDFTVYDPLIRFATAEEKARWLELHVQDEWFQAVAEGERSKYIPNYIVVDGFGRCEDEWRRNEAAEVSFKLLNTSDRFAANWLGLILNTTQRKPSVFDIAETMKETQHHYGWNRTVLARRVGVSKSTVTQVMKCLKLNAEDRMKAIQDGWSLNKIRKHVDKLANPDQPTKSDKPDAMKGKKRKNLKTNINNWLEQGVVKKGTRAEAFLQGFLACIEFEDGAYLKKTTLDNILEDAGLEVDKFPHAIDEVKVAKDDTPTVASSGGPKVIKKKKQTNAQGTTQAPPPPPTGAAIA